MLGELLYFSIYTIQQLGVVLCVGAQTILLCAHLVALHHGEAESPLSHYARAARMMLGAGLALVIISGAAAVGVHYAAGERWILLTPVFLAKWTLIAGLAAVFVAHGRTLPRSNVVYAIVGGNWYAVFLIHTLAPLGTWASLGMFYAAWMVTFCIIWFGFVGLVRLHRSGEKPQQAPSKVLGLPSQPAQPDHLPMPPVAPVVVAPKLVPPPPPPKPAPMVVIPPPPKPEPAVMQGPIDAHVHTDLPIVAPAHSLTVFEKAPEPPLSPVPPPAPVTEKKSDLLHEIVDHLLMPALRIMPQRPEDISNEKRGPLIK